MAWGKIKTEMTGTGGGRWNPRAVAKRIAKKARRRKDKQLARQGKRHGDSDVKDR